MAEKSTLSADTVLSLDSIHFCHAVSTVFPRGDQERIDQARVPPLARSSVRTGGELHPGVRALDLARMIGQEKPAFKVNVRKLKRLGLTESLEVGYRLSQRGSDLLKHMAMLT